MSDITQISHTLLHQYLEKRNQGIKNTIETMYINTAKGILMKPPFAYTELSAEVATEIIQYGEKIRVNSEDDDPEMDELNTMGDDFQALQDSVIIEFSMNDDGTRQASMKHQILYPMPSNKEYVEHATVSNLSKCLEKIRDFLRSKACRGFIATVVMLGADEDGVVFSSGETVPVDVFESQIQQMLENRGELLLPRIVDLLFLHKDRHLTVSSIQDVHKQIERYTVQPQ